MIAWRGVFLALVLYCHMLLPHVHVVRLRNPHHSLPRVHVACLRSHRHSLLLVVLAVPMLFCNLIHVV